MAAKMRLTKGKGYMGPEYVGCCNTGRRVVILHSRLGKYLVGTELAVDAARDHILIKATSGHREVLKKRVIKTSCGKVHVYKGGSSAWAKWNELNDKVIAWNRAEKDQIEVLRSGVRHGDIESTLTLGLDK